MVTLRQLRYFTALAETLHFKRAAERCAITQPALSMQIQELESLLGVRLIERQRGRVHLTQEGSEIAGRARGITAAAQDLVDFARQGTQPLAGTLRLGVIPSIAPYILPRLLPPLRDCYPSLQLSLRETQTAQLVEELLEGELDLLLLAMPVDRGGIETLPVFEDAFLLAVQSRPDGHAATVRPDDIAAADLLLLEEGHCLRDQVLSYCEGLGPKAAPGLGATSLATIIEMVANGFGVTLLPEISAGFEARDKRVSLLQFEAPGPSRTVGLAWRTGSSRAGDAEALGLLLRNVVAPPRQPDAVPGDQRVGTGTSPR